MGLKVIFYSLIVIFIILALYVFFPSPDCVKTFFFPVIAFLGILFFILGIALVVLSWKLKGKIRFYFILTGASVFCILIFAILHNLVYGLFILLFGEGFWGNGGDEPVFFILAVIVCPILFIIGAVKSFILLRKKKK